MKLNAINEIDSDVGRYIVLCSYGAYEGLRVVEQFDDLQSAVKCAMSQSGSTAVVQLTEVGEL